MSEAHIISCLHTMRGQIDIFAQLINKTVVANPIFLDKFDISKVLPELPPGALQDRLNQLVFSHGYRYVLAFINTKKHRQLVDHQGMVSFEEDRYGIKLGAFTYRGVCFSSYWDREVLEGAIEVSNAIVDCGRLLNDLPPLDVPALG